ncbi:gtrA-like family protein [Lactobacillus selangorensis]|uniref:GtrA-like family protein n=1 Tax=Lactobacillus selangorensis TaxID=81857 RepID=A0A0R2FI69_9LACO|nr:GtrA family protein [Lactobacillus selangorensis]KRN28338.1 gtrA-like family protein [Lactobacillus selangorensis]KRN31840.1 gtrA-like family protein [Lactobacillus selangorensis]
MQTIRNLYEKYRDILAYLVFGVLTTLINIVVYWFCTSVLHWNYMLANNLAWFLSVLFAFFTNKTFVFRSKYTTVKAFFIEMGAFFFARGVSLILDDGIMFVGISLLHWSSLLTKFIDQFVVIAVNYIFSKWIFRKK